MSTYTDIRYDYNLPSTAGGAMKLISEQTASSSASLSFTTGIDSTYRTYLFKFINMHPATDLAEFQFNLSTDGGSNYNVTKTTTLFRAYHFEDGSVSNLLYDTDFDLAQSTSYQTLNIDVGNGADESCSGDLYLFNPSDTTFVKHFIATVNGVDGYNIAERNHIAGYGNTVSACNAVDFKFSAGNIDEGTIKMYGIA